MALDQAVDFPDVFRYFDVVEDNRSAESCYAYAPVFPAVVGGRRAVIKRTTGPESAAAAITGWVRELAARGVRVVTPLALEMSNPARVGEKLWVAYPWVDGRPYDGSTSDIVAAGDLLGRIHVLGAEPDPDMPRFPWPDHDAASVEEDITGLQRVLGRHAPEIHDAVLERMAPWLESFMAETLPVIRDAALPFAVVSMDFKANNLVYVDGEPVLVDPDNAEYAPRLLDLAMAALLFHTEQVGSPPRLFTQDEWSFFFGAYSRHVKLVDIERVLWPVAMRYMILEWGTWTLIDADECNDWTDARKREFLVDLALTDADRYRIS